MATLKYVGTPSRWDIQAGSGKDVTTLGDLNQLLSLNMTMPQATTQINTALQPYAAGSYATTAMTGLATPAFLNTQVTNYVPVTTVNQANAPAGLGSASGQVSTSQIAATSTQKWPSPFWSPSSYQLAGQVWPITATTDPVNLYTVAIPYPGYTYTVACFGLMDCQVAADGAYPQILVRQGSTTGPIVAGGYGLAESYLGPVPGSSASQAFLGSGTAVTNTWAAVPGWTATNNGGFTTTMLGNFLSVPNTTVATLSASLVFAGAVAGGGLQPPSTSIRIVNNSGTVIATGVAITGASGTCTASFTGQFTSGQLYTVQAQELNITGGFGSGSFATFSSGTLTLNPSQASNTAMVTVTPAPFQSQTPQTGPTTLYVMLASSDSTTQVSASTFDPGMWVSPIPWAS